MRLAWQKVLGLSAVLIGLFASVSIYTDVGRVGASLASLGVGPVVAALLLALGNYLLRMVRWELYLRREGVRVPIRTSALVFLSGFAMSVTPGKIGELLKASLLKQTDGVPVSRTASVVIAERVADMVALVLLALIGAAVYGVATRMALAGAVSVLLGLAALSIKPLAGVVVGLVARVPRLGRIAPRLEEVHARLAGLVSPRPLAWATALSLVAWLLECVGFAVIVRGFPGAHVSLGLATLIYVATTVAGALTFLPGGLVVTEASMVVLLVGSASGLDQPSAVAATLVTRLCTLWFAVVIGVVALATLRRLVPDPAPAAPNIA